MERTPRDDRTPVADKCKVEAPAELTEDDENLWKRSKSDASFFLTNVLPQTAKNSAQSGNVSEHSKVYWDIPEAVEASELTEESTHFTRNQNSEGDIGRENDQFQGNVRRSEKSVKSGASQVRVHHVHFQDGHARYGLAGSPMEDQFCRRQSTPVAPYSLFTGVSTPATYKLSSNCHDPSPGSSGRSFARATNKSINGLMRSTCTSSINANTSGTSRQRLSSYQSGTPQLNSRLPHSRFRAGSMGFEKLDRLGSPDLDSSIMRIRSSDSFPKSDLYQSRYYKNLGTLGSPASYILDQPRTPDRLESLRTSSGINDVYGYYDFNGIDDVTNSFMTPTTPGIRDIKDSAFSSSLENFEKSFGRQLEELMPLISVSSSSHNRNRIYGAEQGSKQPASISRLNTGRSGREQLAMKSDVIQGDPDGIYDGMESSMGLKDVIDKQCEAFDNCTQLLTEMYKAQDAGAKYIALNLVKREGLINRLLERLAEPVSESGSTEEAITTMSEFHRSSSTSASYLATAPPTSTGTNGSNTSDTGTLATESSDSKTTMYESSKVTTSKTSVKANYYASTLMSLDEKQDVNQLDRDEKEETSSDSMNRKLVICSAQLLSKILADDEMHNLLYTDLDQTEDLNESRTNTAQEPLPHTMTDQRSVADDDESQTVSHRSGWRRLKTLLKGVIKQTWLHRKDVDVYRAYLEVIEPLLKRRDYSFQSVVDCGGLRLLVHACRSDDLPTLRHAALSLALVALFGGENNQSEILHQHAVPWLFRLAFYPDEVVQYFAFLASVVLSTDPELEDSIVASGTLKLVLPFVETHSPIEFARHQLSAAFACSCATKEHRPVPDQDPTTSHSQTACAKPKSCGTCYTGAEENWLERLLPLLDGARTEVRVMALFHFVVEATLKSDVGRVRIFYDINAVSKLHEVACRLHPLESDLAGLALELLGEPVPYRLNPQVPLWTPVDVRFWLARTGFTNLVPKFEELQVDGDLLLCLNEEMLKNDLNVFNGIERLRLIRELRHLKSQADYSALDPSNLAGWLAWANSVIPTKRTALADLSESACVNVTGSSVAPVLNTPSNHTDQPSLSPLNTATDLVQYTYALLKAGLDRSLLPLLTESALIEACHVTNAIHRARILLAVQACFSPNPSIELDPKAIGSADPSTSNRTLDCFISYRRTNGSPLASLLKVHLELRHYRVFLDIDRLFAGKFNESLIHSIRSSTNFVLVLTPNALDRCVTDVDNTDWVHREIACALQSKCNIIPVTENFVWPKQSDLPEDICSLTDYNAVNWIHEYQEACIDKMEKFMIKPADRAQTGRQLTSTPLSALSSSPPCHTLASSLGSSFQDGRSPMSEK